MKGGLGWRHNRSQRRGRRWRRPRGGILTTVALCAILLLVPIALVWAPKWALPAHKPNEARIKLENNVRSIGLQTIGGALLLLGAIFTARTLRINTEGQLTDRFNAAVDKLDRRGSTSVG